jgi:hypothetical protein
MEIELKAWWDANRHLYMIPVATGGVAPTVTGGNKPAVFHGGGRIPRSGLINAQEGEHMLSRGVSAVGGAGGSESFEFDINIDISGGGDAGLVEQIRDVTSDVMMDVIQTISLRRGKTA